MNYSETGSYIIGGLVTDVQPLVHDANLFYLLASDDKVGVIEFQVPFGNLCLYYPQNSIGQLAAISTDVGERVVIQSLNIGPTSPENRKSFYSPTLRDQWKDILEHARELKQLPNR